MKRTKLMPLDEILEVLINWWEVFFGENLGHLYVEANRIWIMHLYRFLVETIQIFLR